MQVNGDFISMEQGRETSTKMKDDLDQYDGQECYIKMHCIRREQSEMPKILVRIACRPTYNSTQLSSRL